MEVTCDQASLCVNKGVPQFGQKLRFVRHRCLHELRMFSVYQ
jgi:hypothetical protein